MRSPLLLIDTSTIILRSSPSPLNSTAVLLQVADCDPEKRNCAALRDLHEHEALSCKGFCCANIVNEMEAKNDYWICPS